MMRGVFLLVVGILPYVWSAPTGSEMVWLRDVTSTFKTERGIVIGCVLPDDLIFNLNRRSHVLTLNLKRNHGIDPNADVYLLTHLKDGRPLLEKTHNLEKEDVAYYQDRDNGAFMTVKCVKRSNAQFDRVINGNIRIRNRNYDLRLAETDVTSRSVLDVPDLLGTRYVLHDQANTQREISVENKDASNVNEKNVEKERMDQLRRFPHGHNKQSHFPRSTLSSGNVAGLHNRGAKDKKDNTKQVYNVEITVVIDSGIWDLYSSLLRLPESPRKDIRVKRNIREAYSHVINGVNMLYQEIEDPSIDISVTLREFYIYKTIRDFPHKSSVVQMFYGQPFIDVNKYLSDFSTWDTVFGSKSQSDYDHAMLFTRHNLYDGFPDQNAVIGLSHQGGVCDKGKRVSVIEVGDFFNTVNTATHELGHNLGADHDGEGNATACNPDDSFIMSPHIARFNRSMPYSRNPWIFSNCSVEAFKKTLKDKQCLTNKGIVFDEDEWKMFMERLPGEVYPPNKQCELINGPKSVYCGTVPEDICRFMQCTDPKTDQCLSQHFSAASGTKCGENMWCTKGLCVSKPLKAGPSCSMPRSVKKNISRTRKP